MRRASRAKATARRPGLRSKNDLTKRGRASGRKMGGWSNVTKEVKKRINDSTRIAAAAIMNDLAEIGPATTGAFRDSWVAIAIKGGRNQPSPSGYPYETKDIPLLDVLADTMDTVRVFEIKNNSPYADYAMDLKPGKWMPHADPIGGIDFGVEYGRRPKGKTFRGEVIPGKSKRNYSTAELDWYTTYVNGGQMHDSVRLALSRDYAKLVMLPPGRQ